MALDSAAKRGSAICVSMPWRPFLPLPDATIAPGDRQAVPFMYSGILAGAAIARAAVGGTGRRIKREEFERRLKEQRDNTFGRRRWAELKELEAAEEAASRLALETESKAQRKALEAAAQAARTAARQIEAANVLPAREVAALTLSLQAAIGAARIKASLDEAKVALALAGAVMAAIRQAEDDAAEEEEAIELLSLLS